MLRFVITAMLAFGAGAGATYGTIQLTATCPAAHVLSNSDDKFLSAPDFPLTGYQKY